MTYDFDYLTHLIKEKGRVEIRDLLISFLEGVQPELSDCPGGAGTNHMSKHHGENGGLIRHICQMFRVADSMNVIEGTPLTNVGEILTVCVLHDIHKVRGISGSYYEPNMLKNGSRSTAKPWRVNKQANDMSGISSVLSKPYEELTEQERVVRFMLEENKQPSGGVASLLLVAKEAPKLYARLTESEMFAIRYHDGLYANSRSLIQSKEDATYILCHAADMISARCDTVLWERGI